MSVTRVTPQVRTIATVIADLMNESTSFKLILTSGEEVGGRPLSTPGPSDTAVEIVGAGSPRRFVHLLHVVEIRSV